MVGVLAFANRDSLGSHLRGLIEEAVSVNHVVNDAALANLLRLELRIGRQVMTIVVAKMVVRGDGEGLDTSVDEEFSENGLELGLSRLQVVTTDEGLVALSELDGTRDEGVLGSAIDEGLTLENGCNGEESGRGDLSMRSLDRLEQVVRCVVDSGDDVAVALGVGGPEDNNTIQVILLLELADVRTDMLKVCLLVFTWDQIVGTSLLVGSDEIGVVDRGERLPEKGHMGSDLTLEIVVENLGALHGFVERKTRDIPSAEDEVIGMHHWEHIGDRDMDLLARARLSTNAHGRCTKDRSDIVGLLDASLGVPDNVVTVGEDGRAESRAVVASHADHHQTAMCMSEPCGI